MHAACSAQHTHLNKQETCRPQIFRPNLSCTHLSVCAKVAESNFPSAASRAINLNRCRWIWQKPPCILRNINSTIYRMFNLKVDCSLNREYITSYSIYNLLAPELYIFFNFSTPVYKMWIIREPNMLELWNKLHFEEKKTESIYHV